jgi:hypothetical protein
MILGEFRLAFSGNQSDAFPDRLGPSKSAVLPPVPTENAGEQLDHDRPLRVGNRQPGSIRLSARKEH